MSEAVTRAAPLAIDWDPVLNGSGSAGGSSVSEYFLAVSSCARLPNNAVKQFRTKLATQ